MTYAVQNLKRCSTELHGQCLQSRRRCSQILATTQQLHLDTCAGKLTGKGMTAQHLTQLGVGLSITAPHLGAPAILEGWFRCKTGWGKPAWYDLLGHCHQAFLADAPGAGVPKLGIADHRPSIGQGGGEQPLGMLTDQLLTHHTTDGGADKVEALSLSVIGQGQSLGGQISRSNRAFTPRLAGTMAW